MDMIVWIFHNVMPWAGVLFTVLTVIYLFFLIVDTVAERHSIKDHYDFMNNASEISIIIAVLQLLFLKVVSFLVEKLIKAFKKIT